MMLRSGSGPAAVRQRSDLHGARTDAERHEAAGVVDELSAARRSA